jgi:autotransporter translocation and assembly factor TamB
VSVAHYQNSVQAQVFYKSVLKNLTAANRVIPDLGLVMEGSRADHQITWQMTADPVEAEGILHGALDNEFNWQGESQAGTVNVGDFSWQLTAPFAVNWQQLRKHITLAPHCWLAEQAQLCSLDNLEASPQAAHAHFDLSQIRN